MTDLGWEDLISMEMVYRKHVNALPYDNENGDGQYDLEHEDKECMTDLAWQELVELEESYRNNLKDLFPLDATDEHSMCKGERNTVDIETMTDLDFEELEEIESCYHRYLDEKVSVKSRDETETMTEIVWEELLQRTNSEVYLSLSEAINEKVTKRNFDVNEVGIMTDLELSELAKIEEKYLRYVEHESNINVQKEELVEVLPEIVLDTFPEDNIVNTKEEYAMTDLTWNDIINLQDNCYVYERNVLDLERKVATFKVQKDEKSSGTEMSFTDLAFDELIGLEAKCSGYKSVIKELEGKLAQYERNDARFNVGTKDAETMTDVSEGAIDNEGLPEVVLANFPSDIQTKDECDMTDVVWDEVVDLKNTYQDYRENLEEMKQKLAQFDVEKDDKESITDIAMQDLADLESMYKEHLREADSDTNSVLSHAEKESRECMTELTFIEITELEDFYIENAAREMAVSPIVEKWEQESMTDITLDDMQYLEEAEYFVTRNSRAAEKLDKYTVTELTIHDLVKLQEIATRSELLQGVEKVEVATLTNLTIPDLEFLEDNYDVHQNCPVHAPNTLRKEHIGVGTELTGEDLKYWQDVEAAHEECLLDKESEKGCEEKQDAEIMTDLTIADLQYLEEVDAAHEECLVDKEEELKGKETIVERESIEIMTDMTISHLQYLEKVEAAHEECLVDKQEELEGKEAFVEKESVEIMTDMSISDLQYLEEVEAAHEECLVNREEEIDRNEAIVEKESVEIMTDMTICDLQYLEEVEAAHEECLVDKQEELERNETTVERESIEIMTDMTISYLQYLEEESKAKTTDSEKLSVGTMTKMTKLDLRNLESIAFEKEKTKTPKPWKRRSRSSSLTDYHDYRYHHHHKNTMTEITGNILDYYEEIDVLYKENMVEFDELKRIHNVEKEEKDAMTDVTSEDLKDLEQKSLLWREKADEPAGGVAKDDAEVMTDLTTAELEYFEEAESLLRKISGENGGMAPKDEKEVLTDLKSSDIEYLQVLADIYDDGSRGVHVEVEAEKCDKETETELRLADIRDLEDQVISEAAIKSMHAVKEAVNDDLVPETLVNLQAELDFLPILDEPEYIFDDEDNENDIQRAETGIMTEMTIANIRDLEDQRNSTTEVEAFVDDLQAEALEGLQTGVEYRPVLDEPGMVFEEEVNGKHILRHDTGVMTELTLSHLENFDKDNLYRRHDDLELTRRVETSVQCDLEDVNSLMQELTREAENKGEDIPAWFVSALRLRQPEGGLLSVLYLMHVHVSGKFC